MSGGVAVRAVGGALAFAAASVPVASLLRGTFAWHDVAPWWTATGALVAGLFAWGRVLRRPGGPTV